MDFAPPGEKQPVGAVTKSPECPGSCWGPEGHSVKSRQEGLCLMPALPDGLEVWKDPRAAPVERKE